MPQPIKDLAGYPVSRDIASTRFLPGEMHVSARGHGYITAYDGKADFIQQCQRVNLEWLVPTKKNITED